MNTKDRKLITCHKIHHRRADIERFYIKRENDGRNLIQLELIYKTIIIGLKKYLDVTTDWMLQLVNAHEKKNSISKERDMFFNQLELKPKEIHLKDKVTKTEKKIKREN